MKTEILISTSTFGELDNSPLKKLEQKGFKVTLNPYKRKLVKAELLELLNGKVGLIAGLELLDQEVMQKSQLKVISRCGSGVSNVDLSAAKNLGIAVCSTPDGPTQAVAELALGCLLSLLRQVPQMSEDLHGGKWNKRIGIQLENKNVAIVGFGRIGRRVAELMRPFNVRIFAVDPFLKETPPGIELVTLSAALPMCDVVLIHSAGEGCLFSDKEFSLMKKGAFILNAARGGIIDETALVKALDSHIVAGAWVDTFQEEPYSGELMRYPQVILTPHIGSYTKECRLSMEMQAVDNLLEFLG